MPWCFSEESCDERLMESGAENCYSVLVETGVYSTDSKHTVTLDHSPRDFLPVQDSYSGMITIIISLFILSFCKGEHRRIKYNCQFDFSQDCDSS